MAVEAGWRGLDPSTWSDARAAYLDNIAPTGRTNVIAKKGYKFLLDFENDVRLQQLNTGQYNVTSAGAGATTVYNINKAALAHSRVGNDTQLTFNNITLNTSASTGTITMIIKFQVSDNASDTFFEIYQDANNLVYIYFSGGANTLYCNCKSGGSTTGISGAATPTANLWVKLTFTNVTSVKFEKSTDGTTYTTVDGGTGLVSTNVPTLTGAYPRINITTGNRTFYLMSLSIT